MNFFWETVRTTINCGLKQPQGRVATMHRAKGLEFDEVVLIAKPDRTPGSIQQFDK